MILKSFPDFEEKVPEFSRFHRPDSGSWTVTSGNPGSETYCAYLHIYSFVEYNAN